MNIIHFYRVGHFFYKIKIPFLPFLCKGLIRGIFNSAVDCSTKIGHGSKFAYGGISVVIHKNAVIGRNVTISQSVTIGGRSKKKGVL